jgi:ribonucleoside-diphosphate reductase alpha chain
MKPRLYVVKRNGLRENVSFDKILHRIKTLSYGLTAIDPVRIAQKVIAGLYPGASTSELDELAAEICEGLSSEHHEFQTLSARIAISNMHKNTKKSFSETMELLWSHIHKKTGEATPLISKEMFLFVKENAEELDSAIQHYRDYDYDYFGYKTLERSYLFRINGKVVERIQHLLMRVACGLWTGNLKAALETYTWMSLRHFTHASPTMFNAGTPKPQLSSCFLLTIKEDSIEGIFDTLRDTAKISKYAGGVGLAVSQIRAKGSHISGTNGTSNGLIPMLRVYNDTARYVDQCFAPETLLYTTSNGVMEIKDAKPGMFVLSATGGSNAIEKVLTYEKNNTSLLQFYIKGSCMPIRVTGEHQVLSLIGKGSKISNLLARLKAGYSRSGLMDAKDLKPGDFLCFPIPKQTSVPIKSELRAEDYKFYGVLVANGWIGTTQNRLLFWKSDGTKRKGVLNFVRRYLKKCEIVYTETSNHNRIEFTWSSKNANFPFKRQQLVYLDSQKFVSPEFTELHPDQLNIILAGIFSWNKESFEGNPRLIQGLRWMALKCGYLCGGSSTRIRNPFLRVYKDFVSYERTIYVPITHIEEEAFSGKVYDLEVEKEHTYVTSLGAVHNGGGKRKGAFAVYLEPWHADILEFLDLRKNSGAEELRARDLFYALWIPDLFMDRVEKDGQWSLFCPRTCKDLDIVWGSEFKAKYEKYESEAKAIKVIKARELWNAITNSQIETGVPYMLYKDSCNRKSNQQNLGTIRCSNLCTEIVEYTAPNEIAVCNLASICLPMFVDREELKFDFEKLAEVVRVITRNLNRVIDINFYPVPETKYSNLRNRPIGIGVQGLADAFTLLRLPFESLEAQQLNKDIFEHIYFWAVSESHSLAREQGHYETYEGSPLSKGQFQFDLWGVKVESKKCDWEGLRKNILKDGIGVRNSLFVAPMPTASTSQILGNTECFEPRTSNLYLRRTLAGEFTCVSKELLKDLIKLKLWTPKIRQKLLASYGSVQNIHEIPKDIKELYKTVWEMKNKTLTDMAADRAIFIDQSQSMNVFMQAPTQGKLTNLHFYTWKKGLKTGMYYLRTQAAVEAIQFTVDQTVVRESKESIESLDLQIQKLNISQGEQLATKEEKVEESELGSIEKFDIKKMQLIWERTSSEMGFTFPDPTKACESCSS